MALASEDRKGFYWEDGRARRQEARLNSVSPAQGFGLHLQEERGERYAHATEFRHSGVTGTPGPGARGSQLSRRVGVWSAAGSGPVTLKGYSGL